MHLKLQALLIVALLLPTMVMAEMMSVSFSSTEMRSAPNAMNSSVIAKLAPDTPLTIIEKGPDYYKVKDYRDRSGWVHRALLSSAPSVVITGNNTNVRQGPGTTHPVVFRLSKGMNAKVLEKQGKWVHVQTADGKKGWIAEFLVWGE